jgi:hypothetical protein
LFPSFPEAGNPSAGSAVILLSLLEFGVENRGIDAAEVVENCSDGERQHCQDARPMRSRPSAAAPFPEDEAFQALHDFVPEGIPSFAAPLLAPEGKMG